MHLFLLSLLGAAYFYSGILRVSAVVILPEMGKKLGLDAAMVGTLSSLFFYSYGGTQMFWGWLCDRIGPIKTSAIGYGIATLGAALFSIAMTPAMIGFSRVLLGLGTASIFTSILLHAALTVPPKNYSLYASVIITVGNLGTVVAVAPLGFAVERLGIPSVFVIFTLFSLLLSTSLWFFRKHDPFLLQEKKTDSTASFISSLLEGGRLVLGNRALFVTAIVWATSCASIVTLQGLWASSWLEASHGVPAQVAHNWVTGISVGLVLGSLYGGKVAFNGQGSSRPLTINCLILQLLWFAYGAGAYWGIPIALMGILGFSLGFSAAVSMVYCSNAARQLSDVSKIGTTIGATNMTIFACVILFQWGSGVVLNYFPSDEPGVYTNMGHLISFVPIMLIQIISFVPVPFIKRFSR